MKQIELPHKVCGLTCMVNGLEDLYEQKTGVRLPDWLFLHLSGLLGFVYLRNRRAPAPRMVFWGMNIARYQYEALADIVGFHWQITAGRSFASSLRDVKACLDRDTPALLGPLDMYSLPYYERFYRKVHVPIHHVLMVGYDDEREAALVLDCDRADVQCLPYADLEAAWDVHVPGLGKRNTFYTFAFDEHVADVETIARQGLRKRAAAMLAAPVSMLGLKGMRKLARDLPGWRQELDAHQLDASL
ncbi:MAG: BtrH N-terminal domain-containing protein, partial [Chloroflexota bacterium]